MSWSERERDGELRYGGWGERGKGGGGEGGGGGGAARSACVCAGVGSAGGRPKENSDRTGAGLLVS
jgi:hypothetical protein